MSQINVNAIAPRTGAQIDVLTGVTVAIDTVASNTVSARTGTVVSVNPAHSLEVATLTSATSSLQIASGKSLQGEAIYAINSMQANQSGVSLQKPVTVTTNVVHTPNVLTSAVSIPVDFSLSNVFTLTLADDPTFTFSNLTAGAINILYLNPNGAARTLTWPGGVKWAGTALTSLSSGSVYIVTVAYFNGTPLLTGTTYT